MKTSTVVIILAAILIIAGGAWWYTQTNTGTPTTNVNVNTTGGTNEPVNTNTNPSTSTTTTSGGTSSGAGVSVGGSVSVGAPKTVTVTYTTSGGFSPKTVTINKGDTVKFVAESGQMWVGADEHPSHTQYDGTSRQEHCTGGPSTTSFDQCSVSSSYSFVFTKTGTFDYHNHVSSAQVGTVIVK